MANHVHYSITIHQINDAAREKLKEMFSRVRTDGDYRWFADIFVDGEELTYEQAEKYDYTINNIGPKWCYFEDYDVDDTEPYFNGEGAWSPPTDGLVKLLEILEEYDPNIITTMTYEDEMPNFVGSDVYWGSDCYDGVEEDWDEIVERVIHESDTLTPESYNSEESEWVDDEAQDTFQEEMWEVINDYVWEFALEQVEHIKEQQKEQENEELTGC